LVVFSVTFGLIEIAFRFFPPTGIFHPGYTFDPILGYRFKSYSQIIYNKTNGLVKNTTNKYGFVDKDHSEIKPNHQFRVVFLGDSYVEGLSVPSEKHFFRILPGSIADHSIEYFGMGMSGFGTVHSYINSMKWLDIFDFDLVVYVFVENDIGDNISWIKRKPNRPYAKKILLEPGFSIERNYSVPEETLMDNLKQFIMSHSLVIRVISNRIRLLKKYGPKIGVDEKDMGMKSESKKDIPNQNDLPSTWNQEVRLHAEEVAFNVLKFWNKEVRRAGKHFAVLYVPRGKDYLSKESQANDTFKGWVENSCRILSIPFIDPSEALLENQKKGIEIYRDHFTSAGHEVLAQVINEWLEGNLDYLRAGVASQN